MSMEAYPTGARQHLRPLLLHLGPILLLLAVFFGLGIYYMQRALDLRLQTHTDLLTRQARGVARALATEAEQFRADLHLFAATGNFDPLFSEDAAATPEYARLKMFFARHADMIERMVIQRADGIGRVVQRDSAGGFSISPPDRLDPETLRATPLDEAGMPRMALQEDVRDPAGRIAARILVFSDADRILAAQTQTFRGAEAGVWFWCIDSSRQARWPMESPPSRTPTALLCDPADLQAIYTTVKAGQEGIREHTLFTPVPLKCISILIPFRMLDQPMGLICSADRAHLMAPLNRIAKTLAVLFLFGAGIVILLLGRIILRLRKTEHALRATSALQQAILDSTTYGLMATDMDGIIRSFNSGAEHILGYTGAEVIGRVTPMLFHADEEIRQRAGDLNVAAGFDVLTSRPRVEQAERREWTYLAKDGRRVPVELTVTAIRDPRGRINGYLIVAADITEKKQIMEQLRRNTLVVENSNTVIFIWRVEPGWPVEYVSENVSQFGFTPEQLTAAGRLYSQLILPEDLERVSNELAYHLEHNLTSFALEYRLVCKDGSVRWIDAHLNAVRDGAQALQRLEGVVLDITGRKLMEMALKESEQRFRDVSAAAGEFIFEMDPAGHFTLITEQVIRILGYRPRDMLGASLLDFVPPEERARVQLWFAAAVAGRQPFNGYEYPARTADGRNLWLSISGIPMFDAHRDFQGFRGAGLDVTRRRQDEESLRTSEERLKSALLGAEEGLWDWNIQSGAMYFDDQWAAILGYRSAELTPSFQTWQQLIFPDDLPEVRQRLAESHGPGANRLFEVEHRAARRNGELIWLRVRGRVIDRDAAGQALRMIGTIQDVSRRKREEKKLEHYAAELEQSNRDVKQFAYIVSHDLRAPLVNLKGFSTELTEALARMRPVIDQQLPALTAGDQAVIEQALRRDIPEAIEFITSSVTRMDLFISALLKLSRLGRRELKLELVDPRPLLDEVVKTLNHDIVERQARVNIAALPVICVDRTSIEQIFGNILTNAVLYLQPGRPGRIDIWSERGEGETVFHIRDNGRGIAEEDMDKVFAPFRRAGRQDVKGEGMGLAYVQSMVRRHGGRIWCLSRPGEGTTFSFALPDQAPADARTDTPLVGSE